ncbi:MAG TPA: HAMP domain-containing sensor histidine kinase [Luteimonas sp.]|nr:HAMP domain-containing sensor histidine kinase [Luteimonas sp.]
MSTPPRWLDRLAHDLRGPLTPLQTAAYLLRSGQLEPERQQELFVLIERQTRRLARMIEELGDWSRASQHALLGAREPCEPALLLDNAISGISGIRFADATAPVVVDETGETIVQGDPIRLIQLLRTLIEFAAARNNAPQVRMRIAGDRVQIDVLDPGATPDPAQLAALLEEPLPEPFDEGLGLRLLIARAIAEAHVGTLVAETDVGGGLRLRCELPLAGN